MKRAILIISLFLFSVLVYSQPVRPIKNKKAELKPAAQQIIKAQASNIKFADYSIFSNGSETASNSELNSSVDSFRVFSLNDTELKKLFNTNPDYLNFHLTNYNGQPMELQLYEHKITTDDFTLKASSGAKIPVDFSVGVHYWGIVKNNPGVTVAISIFENSVMGMIFSEYGNIIIGQLKNSTDYIIYNDVNLKAKNSFQCGNENDLPSANKMQNNSQNLKQASTVNCVRLYWEINYDVFLDKGSFANTSNFATGVFNQTQLFFSNDNIDVSLETLVIWDVPSPYTGFDTATLLTEFQTNVTSFNGDLGHLLGYEGGGGLAATINGLCGSWDDKKCVSEIDDFFNTVPTFSWTVMVVCHEQGHLMGSPHTHACVWNGNNTAIDGCGPSAGYPYEGSCSGAPVPNFGTVMSYCHLATDIDFNLGFGPQPAALIVDEVNFASCLTPCGPCPPPANDDCANATLINDNVNCVYTSGTVDCATDDGLGIANCDISGTSSWGVWYEFVAQATDVTIEISPDNVTAAGLDAVLVLYNGSCGFLAEVGCMDNFAQGGTEILTVTGLTIGQSYWVRVYDWGTVQPLIGDGGFQICVTHTGGGNLPNLTLDEFSASNSLIVNGNDIDMVLDIMNNGSVSAGATSTLSYYLCIDPVIAIDDYLIGSDIVGNLASGANGIESIIVDACTVSPSIPNGTYYVAFKIDSGNIISESDETDNEWYWTTPLVVVNCACVAPATPGTPTSNSPQCGNVTVTRTGTPPAGVTWYWQGTSCGTSTSLGSGATYNAAASGTYYIRAYDNTGLCWSTTCASVAVTIGSTPSTPGTPTSNSPQCSSVTITRNGTPPANVTWYWQGTTCGTSTSLGSGATYNATSSGTYYIRAYNTAGQCWSNNCASVSVTLSSVPADPGTPTSNSPQCSSVTITRTGTPPAGVTWYWQGTTCGTSTSLGSGATYSATSSGTYYIRAYDNAGQCWSPNCTSISVTVSGAPSNPGTPTSNSPQCNSVTIIRNGTPPAGVTWYWQDTNCGTSMAFGSGATYTANASGTYYIRAYDNTGQCWSSCSNVSVTVTGTPTDPAVPTSNSPQCNSVTITRTGTPPAGVTWYWQGTTCGTSMALGSGATYNATTSGTYYIRAYDNTGQCWSPNCGSINVTVTSMPTDPATPTSNSPQCDDVTIIRTGTPPAGVTWYWQGPTCGTSMALGSGSTYIATASGTYYIRAYDNSGQCWSSNCGSVNVAVNPSPVLFPLTVSGNYIIVSPVSVTDMINWIYPSGSNNGTIDSFLCVSSGNYYCTVTNSFGCSTTSDTVNVICTVGINDLTTENVISVYPNPADEIIYVKGEGLSNGKYEIILTNTLGQELKKHTATISDRSMEIKLSISDLAGGVYFLSISSDEVKRVVKVQKL